MSIRKVSDLPSLKNEEIISAMDSSNEMALLELSYRQDSNPEEYSWVSKKCGLGQFRDIVLGEMISSDYDFSGTKNFYDGINVSGFVNVDGDLIVNRDDPQAYDKYHIYLKAQDITLDALSNIFVGLSANILCSDSNDIYSFGGRHLAHFGGDNISFGFNEYGTMPLLTMDPDERTATADGDWYFSKPIHGVALSACWADLAEQYASDAYYEPGTLVRFGGKAELTVADAENGCDAVVTTRPGLILNSDGRDGYTATIALVGRTPVRVKGRVRKFDRISVSDTPGVGKAAKPGEKAVAKALADKDSDGIGLVECVTRFEF